MSFGLSHANGNGRPHAVDARGARLGITQRSTIMNVTRIVAAVSAVLFGLSMSAAGEEKLDSVIKQLDDQYAKIKTYSAKTKTTTDFAYTPEYKQKSEMVGTMEWARKGDKVLFNSVTDCDTQTTQSGETKKTKSKITSVCDGDFLYAMNEEDGHKTVMKNKAPVASDTRPSAMFKQLREHMDIKLLDDAQVDGADCFVVEMTLKPMEGVPPQGRQVQYYRKDHGMMVKSEGFDANGKLTTSTHTTDIKLNGDISDDHFKFEIPADAQVTDMTTMQQPGQTQAQAGETQEEQPAEQKPEDGEQKDKKEKKGLKLPKKLPKIP